MRKMIGLALTLSFTAAALAADHAETPTENWPSWRGPTANGIAPAGANPPIRWDAARNIRWKAELPGSGSATPIIWGDQVFIVTAVETDREAKPDELPKPEPRFETKTNPPTHFYRFEVLSFDRNTGKLRWRQTAAEAVPHEGHHPTHSYAAGSPATDGKRLYVSCGSFGVSAYDLAGKRLWSRDLGRLHTRLGWGEAVTPVVHGDAVLLNRDQEADSKLVALDAATGNTRWETLRDEKTSWNTPCVVEHGGRMQVIVNATNRIRSYDVADGQLLWQVGGMTANAIPSPVAVEGVAYVVSGYGGAAAVAVPLDSRGDLTNTDHVIWRYAKGTPYVPSPLLLDGRLYFTQGNTQLLTVLNAQTGKPIVTAERLPGVSAFYASPMAAAGRIYFAGRDGTTVVLKAGDRPEVLAINKLGDPVDASPAVAGRQLFLRGQKFLYCIEEK
jgi:outer membrane protein assembly factor BamB